MKNVILGAISLIFVFLAYTNAHAGPAVIFNGDVVKTLKPGINLFDMSYIVSGTLSPLSNPILAPKGSLYLMKGGGVYVKNDNGATTNWSLLQTTASSGSVSSVGLTLPNIFSVSGSPVTTTGTLAATFVSQTANTVLASPDGSSGTPTFRALTSTDIPNLSASKITSGKANFTTSTTGVNVTGGTNSVFASTSVNIDTADATHVGLLTALDWTSFNSKVNSSLTISTTPPLEGGGTLANNLSLTVDNFTSTTDGTVPASGGGTTNFLRADGTWQSVGGAFAFQDLSNLTSPVKLNQPLGDSTGVTSYDADARTVTSSSSTLLADFANGIYYNGSANPAVDTFAQQLFSTGGVSTVLWNATQLIDTGGNIAGDWTARSWSDSAANKAITYDVSDRKMYDATGTNWTIDYNNLTLGNSAAAILTWFGANVRVLHPLSIVDPGTSFEQKISTPTLAGNIDFILPAAEGAAYSYLQTSSPGATTWSPDIVVANGNVIASRNGANTGVVNMIFVDPFNRVTLTGAVGGNILFERNLIPAAPDTLSVGVLGDPVGQVHSDNIYVSNSGADNALITYSTTTPSGVGGVIGFSSLSAQGLSFFTTSDATANTNPTANLYFETGNKTAGTGGSGSFKYKTGTSSGGDRGSFDVDASWFSFPQHSADPSGTPPEGAAYMNTTSHKLRVYNGSAWADAPG